MPKKSTKIYRDNIEQVPKTKIGCACGHIHSLLCIKIPIALVMKLGFCHKEMWEMLSYTAKRITITTVFLNKDDITN